jgi:hypothetical protein
MNFWKYTFRGKFLKYAILTVMSCIAAALPLYILHQVVWVYTIFGTYISLFLFSVVVQLYRWKLYMKKRVNQLKDWGFGSRLN